MIKIVKAEQDNVCSSCRSEIDVYHIKITLNNNAISNELSLCDFCLRKLKRQIEEVEND